MLSSGHHSAIIFNMNERLFFNALAGVTDEMARQRISDHNNPMNWIATHTVWARYNTAAVLGKMGTNPYNGLFEKFRPFDESMKFDSLDKIREEWKKASVLVREGLALLTEQKLAADAPFKNPTGDQTLGGTLAFFAQHESYDIGQMGLMKKYLTNEAMSYA